MVDFSNAPFPSRLEGAVKKFNASNEQKIVAETNYFAEFDNDYKLLQEYNAFKTPVFKGIIFEAVSSDTVKGIYKRKNVEIKRKISDDGNKRWEISFEDGSQISYLIFFRIRKMKINGEEFEMPEGTIVETKSVQGRIFSQLIQIPEMSRVVITLPDFEKVEQVLEAYKPVKNAPAVMPTAEYMQNLLAGANSGQPLLYLSKDTSSIPNRTPSNEIKYLENCIAQGKLPQNTLITGVKEGGGKILTIEGDNCKYEVCGSEMRVLDNSGDTKIIARYESARASHGLWVVSYDDGKPLSGLHYTSGNLCEPVSTVTYTYNDDNTVTAATSDGYESKKSTFQMPSEGLSVVIDGELKIVPSDKAHLGSVFENQAPFVKPEE